MTRIGFTGTQYVPDDRVVDVYDYLYDETITGTEFTTGACVGFDALAAHWLLDHHPNALHRLVVPAQLRKVDVSIVERFRTFDDDRHVIEHMPVETTYRDRNERIVDHADAVVAVAAYPEDDGRSTRSGTWMTVRIARRRPNVSLRDPFVLNPQEESG